MAVKGCTRHISERHALQFDAHAVAVQAQLAGSLSVKVTTEQSGDQATTQMAWMELKWRFWVLKGVQGSMLAARGAPPHGRSTACYNKAFGIPDYLAATVCAAAAAATKEAAAAAAA